MKKVLRETQTLCAGCSEAEPKIFAPPQTPFLGARDSQNLIRWRRSLPSPTDPVWWRSMHAISSYRGNRATNRQDRLPHTAPLSLASSVIKWVFWFQYFGFKRCGAEEAVPRESLNDYFGVMQVHFDAFSAVFKVDWLICPHDSTPHLLCFLDFTFWLNSTVEMCCAWLSNLSKYINKKWSVVGMVWALCMPCLHY